MRAMELAERHVVITGAAGGPRPAGGGAGLGARAPPRPPGGGGGIMRAMELAEGHVVITGGAGGLGPAVVDAMLAAGAICPLPVRADGDRLPRNARILAVEGVDLADEAAVTSFYARCPPLWA